MTIPQYDAVPQYDVEADNDNAKKRSVSSAMPVKTRAKTPSPDQSPRAGLQSQPIRSTMRCHSMMWKLTMTMPKSAVYRQLCRPRHGPKLRLLANPPGLGSSSKPTHPQYDAVPQSRDQSPRAGLQSQPIHSTMRCHSMMWTLTIMMQKRRGVSQAMPVKKREKDRVLVNPRPPG
jgi:hypothetical protein